MAVKTYSYKKDKDTKLSDHFTVKEFASISGSKLYTDTVLIDTYLVDKLEKLYSAMNCSKIIINSGYRCPTHDKAVGGSGSGQHVNGKAADIVCYGKDGNVIHTKYVCCMATEVGFGGVANISANYRATHVDTRTTKYYGDEIYNYSSIWYRNRKWTDFYVYFNLNRDEVLKMFAVDKAIEELPTTNTDSTQTEDEKIVESKLVIINGNWNVRKTPATGSIIKVVNEGTICTYTETKTVQDSTWYYLNEIGGWVSGKGVSTKNVTEIKASTNLIIAKGTWNVRKTAGSGNIITTVKSGSSYSYSKTTKVGSVTWYYLDKIGGWLSGKAVSKTY